MGRQPIATVVDHFGDEWDVWEIRDTPHPFPVYLGRPSIARGEARGGKRVILTPELVAHLERHRRDNFASMALPIGSGAIKRLRRLLGHHRYTDAREWWEARFDDLCTLTLEAFSAKHGVKAGATEQARLLLVGRINRENGWWREPAIRDLLTSDRPAAVIAEEMGIPAGSVGRLRTLLKAEGHAVPTDYRERIARSRRGKPVHPNTLRGLLRAARRKKSKSHRAAMSASQRRFRATRPRWPPANPKHREWTPAEDRLLGKTLDRVIAGILGRTIVAVRERRRKLGIPISRHSRLRQAKQPGT